MSFSFFDNPVANTIKRHPQLLIVGVLACCITAVEAARRAWTLNDLFEFEAKFDKANENGALNEDNLNKVHEAFTTITKVCIQMTWDLTLGQGVYGPMTEPQTNDFMQKGQDCIATLGTQNENIMKLADGLKNFGN